MKNVMVTAGLSCARPAPLEAGPPTDSPARSNPRSPPEDLPASEPFPLDRATGVFAVGASFTIDATATNGRAAIAGIQIVGHARLAGEIPEPATMVMLGLAVAGLGGYVKRRRRA